MIHLSRLWHLSLALVLAFGLGAVSVSAQRRDGVPALPPADRPVVLHTAEVPRIRVVPIAAGLSHPWGLAFRRNGDILVTERDKGTLWVIRNGQFLDRAFSGVPEVFADVGTAGLMDVAVHPNDDRLVYLTYSKLEEREGRRGAVALARGRLEGRVLTEVRDIFVANEMYRDTMISDETWAALSERYDAHQMMSNAATAARYRMVSMTLNAFGVQPLPDDERFPVLEGY